MCVCLLYFYDHRKKSNTRDTWEVDHVKFRGFGMRVLVLARGGGVFLGCVGTRNGAVLSFSVLVFSNI